MPSPSSPQAADLATTVDPIPFFSTDSRSGGRQGQGGGAGSVDLERWVGGGMQDAARRLRNAATGSQRQ